MERQPATTRQALGARISELLNRATERSRENPLFADSQGYKSIGELVDSRLSSWEYERFPSEMLDTRRRLSDSDEPSEVSDTRAILALPEDELDKHGATVDMLRGYLAHYDGDAEGAIWHIDHAQTGYLENGDLSSYATASAKLAKIAREIGFVWVAERAHRNAIEGYQHSQELYNTELIAEGRIEPIQANVHSLSSFYEYRRLARTLGTKPAVQEYGTEKLIALRKEIEEIGGVKQSEAVFAVLALMQTEYELSKWSRSGRRHYRLARHYGFICTAADMGGGLGSTIMLDEHSERPSVVNTVEGWKRVFAKGAPGAIVGGANYGEDLESSYW